MLALRRSARGLKLVEMLIVMIVVVLLTTLITAAISRAKTVAYRTACAANLRDLTEGYTTYSVYNRGNGVSYSYTPGAYWIDALATYNPRLNVYASRPTGSSLLMCAAATTYAKDIGTGSSAWGPSSTFPNYFPEPYCPTYSSSNNSDFLSGSTSPSRSSSYAGGYTLNLHAAGYRTTTASGDILASSFSTSGNASITGNIVATGNIDIKKTLNGSATAGGTITGTVTGTKKPGQSGITLPNVTAMYNAYLPAAYTISSTSALNFTGHPVQYFHGDASISSVTGTGTLLVSGNVTGLPTNSSATSLTLVTPGYVDTGNGNHDFYGAIYCAGDVSSQGTPSITGSIISNGSVTFSGSFSFTSAPTGWNASASSGTKNISLHPNLVLFSDGIWPEATPNTGDAAAPSSSAGMIATEMGRVTIARHGSTVNVRYVDGHVDNVNLSKVPSLNWSGQ